MIEAVISVESGGDSLAIHVNNAAVAVPTPRDADDAARIAASFIGRGYSVDLGLMQVNTGNLASLGYSVRQMFDACPNITAGTIVLSHQYQAALRALKVGSDAIAAALSAYNTGNFTDGFSNGYVARYDVSGGIENVMALPAAAGAAPSWTHGGVLRLTPAYNVTLLVRPSIALGWQRVFIGTSYHAVAPIGRPTIRLTDASIFRVSFDIPLHGISRTGRPRHHRQASPR